MPMIPFVGETYQHRSREVSSQLTRNLYPERTKGKEQTILVGTPGATTLCDLTAFVSGACRGLYSTSTGRLFGSWADKLYEIEFFVGVGYIGTLRGAIGAGTTKVSFADDGTYLYLCDGSVMRRLTLATNNLAAATIPFASPTQVLYVGKRFVAVNGSNQFWWTDLTDATSWPALNFATAESSADIIVSAQTVGGNLWLIGDRSYEVRGVTGDPDLPYALIGGSAGSIGCGASGSVAVIGDTLLMLGSVTGQGTVYASQGQGLVRVSNYAIEYAIGLQDASNATAMCYQQEGHVFYCLSLPTLNRTLVYDLTEQLWHERGTANAVTYENERWYATDSAVCFGLTLFGSRLGAVVALPSLSVYTEYDGRYIIRVHQSPVYWDDLRMLFHQSLTIDFEGGVGLINGQGSDPQAMLNWSDDGGSTWGNELWESIGKQGAYGWQARWNGLGMSSERVYRVTISDPVKCVIIGASLTAAKAGR